MDIVSSAVSSAVATQGALKVIALSLQLTAYMFPEQAVVKHGDQYDFIVVGGGTGGSIVASRLSENDNFNVLLIEAGGDPQIEVMTPGLTGYIPKGYLDWNYTTENDKYTMQCHKGGIFSMTSGLALGGSSCANYMLYVRGNPFDYLRWAEIAKDNTWNWENVLPYFRKSVRLDDPEHKESIYSTFYNTTGYVGLTREITAESLKYLESFQELGNDIVPDVNCGYDLGFTQPLYMLSGGQRQSTGYCFLSPAKERPNLHIRKRTRVIQIIFDKDKNAVGVKVVTDDNEEMIIKASKEVIVSAGALNTPKLLMLSGIGPRTHLRSLNIDVVSDLPVGLNLQDHVTVPILHQMERSNVSIQPRDPHKYPYTALIGFVALNKAQYYPDYEVEAFLAEHNTNSILMYSAFNYGYDDFINKILSTVSKGRNIVVSLINNLHPRSRGQVLLRSADPADAPLLYSGYFSDDKDLENIATYVADYARIINTTYFKSVGADFVDVVSERCSEFVKGSKEYWRCYSLCTMHSAFDFSGTAAMGSVVDSHLRVLGVKGVRVADASVIPYIPSGNINGVVMMIAEKVSDMIKRKYSVPKIPFLKGITIIENKIKSFISSSIEAL